LAIFIPYETAAGMLNTFLPLTVSAMGVWLWVQAAGRRALARLKDELAALAGGQVPELEALDKETAKAALLMGADGVNVPFRPEPGQRSGRTVWREVKVALLARLGRTRAETSDPVAEPAPGRLKQRRLVAVRGHSDALRERLWLEALRQGVLNAERVVWLSDGAPGLWGLFEAYLTALGDTLSGILDFYHTAQNLWKGAQAWLDGRTQRARSWFATARHQLRHGEAEAVLSDIAAALERDGLPDSARKTRQNLYTYLDTHRAHIQCDQFKALGLPIGSGMVESACKWLIQQRFKGER
jgi:hypothetical protein